jgi:hypothetical protein
MVRAPGAVQGGVGWDGGGIGVSGIGVSVARGLGSELRGDWGQCCAGDRGQCWVIGVSVARGLGSVLGDWGQWNTSMARANGGSMRVISKPGGDWGDWGQCWVIGVSVARGLGSVEYVDGPRQWWFHACHFQASGNVSLHGYRSRCRAMRCVDRHIEPKQITEGSDCASGSCAGKCARRSSGDACRTEVATRIANSSCPHHSPAFRSQ